MLAVSTVSVTMNVSGVDVSVTIIMFVNMGRRGVNEILQ